MTDPEQSGTPPEELPEAIVARRSRISLVWLVPVVALLIGGWLAYKAYSESGPTIRIQFKTAAGLEAKKTKVKFKDVDVGQVKSIAVRQDMKAVVVTAELVAGAERYLTDKTRFWVARARITPSQVSGLDTLLSGSYIAIDPVTEGKPARDFVGLEVPPLFTTSEPGKKFVLRSKTLGSLNIGSPVYYRQIQVGQVVGYDLDRKGNAVSIELFIAAPNDRLVSTDTRFWNASGVDFTLSTDGLSLDTQSLLSVLIGGVAFDTPPTIGEKGTRAPENYQFPLYASRDEAHEKVYLDKKRFLLFFDGSVRGLSVGAPVLLRGIELGQVLDVQLELDVKAFKFQVPVLVEIEPQRIRLIGGDWALLEKTTPMDRFVDAGLRAQLKSGSLITSQLYVDLDFYPDEPPAEMRVQNGYPVIPTVTSAPLEAISNKVNQLMDTLNGLPLRQIGSDLQDTVKGAKQIFTSKELTRSVKELELALAQVHETAEDLDKQVVGNLSKTLDQARTAFRSASNLVSEDSPLYQELSRTLRELSAAARAARVMADYLERHPEALIRGKGGY
jgi:paraquat-inducible protein B